MESANQSKRIILILGGKGGTGKTLFCRTLYYFLIESGIDCMGYDADIENPEFYQYHLKSEYEVFPLEFLETDRVKDLVTDLKKLKPEVVLLDMPGASAKATREQLVSFGVFDLAKDLGYRITIATVLNNAYNTINSFEEMLKHCQGQADYVAVKSQLWNQGSLNFSRWDESAAKALFGEYNGIEIELPVLDASTFDAIHEKSYSFFEAHYLSFGDICLLQSYLNRSQVELEKAGILFGIRESLKAPSVRSKHMLLPEDATPKSSTGASNSLMASRHGRRKRDEPAQQAISKEATKQDVGGK